MMIIDVSNDLGYMKTLLKDAHINTWNKDSQYSYRSIGDNESYVFIPCTRTGLVKFNSELNTDRDIITMFGMLIVSKHLDGDLILPNDPIFNNGTVKDIISNLSNKYTELISRYRNTESELVIKYDSSKNILSVIPATEIINHIANK